MAIFDIKLPKNIARALRLPENNPRNQQLRVLKKLLRKARFTEFGQKYKFDEILISKHVGKKFQELVPTYNYNKIYKEWWHKTLDGTPNVCWPGKIKYYALSSGTSEASSKYIPITNDLLRGNKIVMIKQLLSLRNYEDIPVRSIGKGWLTLGGSTQLQKGAGYYAGDLSGGEKATLNVKGPTGNFNIDVPGSGFYILSIRKDTLLGSYQRIGKDLNPEEITSEELGLKMDSLQKLIADSNVSVANKNFFITQNQLQKISDNSDAQIIAPFTPIPSSFDPVNGKDPEVYKFYTSAEMHDMIDKIAKLLSNGSK